MEDRHGPVTGYSVPTHNGPPAAAAAGPPPPNGYYNYQPNPYYHQQYYQVSQPDSVQRSSCLRCIFAFVIGLFLIFGTATFIVWLVLRPQLPEFQVDSFSLSNFTFTNESRVFLISEIHLTARNPNSKMSLSYDHVETAVYYKLELLSKTSLSPFSQERKNETPLVAKFAGDGSFVEKPLVDGINGEIGKNANVGFDLRLLSWINFESKSWMSRNILKVFCGNLVVGIPSNGRPGGLTEGPRPCRVGI
ncbi:NDR1/HIN1-like protein 26 [Primulina eburnea]|uniref:NDR1/HIN1-like protein 26 n=1 Tax=Primulina eburnea TaxID=1245227 RepID=UPI003C6C432D